MQIPYRAVEVNPLTKKELKWGAHRKVPVAMLDEEVLLDSSVIISRLAAEAEAAKAQAQQPKKGGWMGRKAAPASAPQPSAASLGVPHRPCGCCNCTEARGWPSCVSYLRCEDPIGLLAVLRNRSHMPKSLGGFRCFMPLRTVFRFARVAIA